MIPIWSHYQISPQVCTSTNRIKILWAHKRDWRNKWSGKLVFSIYFSACISNSLVCMVQAVAGFRRQKSWFLFGNHFRKIYLIKYYIYSVHLFGLNALPVAAKTIAGIPSYLGMLVTCTSMFYCSYLFLPSVKAYLQPTSGESPSLEHSKLLQREVVPWTLRWQRNGKPCGIFSATTAVPGWHRGWERTRRQWWGTTCSNALAISLWCGRIPGGVKETKKNSLQYRMIL